MIHTGDCVEVMAGMEPESVDAIVTDPPYGLEFMGKEWDRLDPYVRGNPAWNARDTKPPKKGRGGHPESGVAYGVPQRNPRCRKCGYQKFNHPKSRCQCERPDWDVEGWHHGYRNQAWHEQWATAALRVAKPGAYLLAFGGTRTVHRLTVALEDAGWIIRDLLVWAYAQGFPKSRSSLKPAWEPIVLCRKPGPLRDLAIDECRIGTGGDKGEWPITGRDTKAGLYTPPPALTDQSVGRWPANVTLTDPIFDGGWEGVVGGGEDKSQTATYRNDSVVGWYGKGTSNPAGTTVGYGDSGTYSRFFLIPKASRSDREPLLPGELEERPGRPLGISQWEGQTNGSGKTMGPSGPRRNTHPTVKPVELMRHLVRLVTPQGGTVLDPFLGSGSTAIAAEQEGFAWVGIEREPEYVAIAEQRLVAVQRGLGLDVPAPVTPRKAAEGYWPSKRAPAEGYSGNWKGTGHDDDP